MPLSFQRTISGLDSLELDTLAVTDAVIENLTVDGMLVVPPVSAGHFTATDSTNQFRADSNTVYVKSTTSASPTFYMVGSGDSALATVLNVGTFVANDSADQFKTNSNTVSFVSTTTTTPTFSFKGSGGATTGTIVDAGSVNTGSITTTAATNQFKSTSSTIFVQSTSTTTPSFSFVGSAGSTAGTTLNIATVAATTINTQGLSATKTINGEHSILVYNPDSGTSAYSAVRISSNTTNFIIFLNSSGRSADGGVNTATVRNDGGNLRLSSNAATITLDTNVNTTNITKITNATACTGVGTGALQVTGGAYVGGDVYTGGTIYGIVNPSTLTITNTSGQTFISNTTQDATTTADGGSRFLGGVSVVKNIVAGGVIYGTMNPTTLTVTNATGQTFISNTTQNATNTTDGGSKFLGGVSIAKNMVSGGSLLFGASGAYSPGCIYSDVNWGCIIRGKTVSPVIAHFSFNKDDGSQLFQIGPVGDAKFFSTTASTSSTTGGLQTLGGLGVASTTDATSSTNGGGGTFAGGVAVAKKLIVGSTITGESSITGKTGVFSTTVAGEAGVTVTNLSNNSAAYSSLRVTSDTGSPCILFQNSTTKSTDGGVGTATLRNDAGNVRVQAQGSKGVTFAASTGNATLDSTTQSTSTSTGSFVTPGGMGVAKTAYLGEDLHLTGSFFGGTTGSFTPSYVSGMSPTYTAQLGHYYRLGNIVHISGYMTTTSAIDLSATNLTVQGTGFTNAATIRALGTVEFDSFDYPTSTDSVVCAVNPSTSNVIFLASRDGLSTQFFTSPTTAVSRNLFFRIVLFVS